MSNYSVYFIIRISLYYCNEGTNVAGAAFLQSECDPLLAFAWVEALRDGMRSTLTHVIVVAVIVHEIGHLLCVNHGIRGVMTPKLQRNDLKSLSDESPYEISKFIDE